MRLLCSICLLLIKNGLAIRETQVQSAVLTPPLADIKAVFQQSFDHAFLAKYLAHYNPDSANFRYESPPVYNDKTIPKPTFDVIVSDRRFICRTAYKQPVHNRGGEVLLAVFISVTQVTINHNSAQVNLKIPNEGVVGLFWLKCESNGIWRVINYSTYET